MIECAGDLQLDRVYDFFSFTLKLLDPVKTLGSRCLGKKKGTYD